MKRHPPRPTQSGTLLLWLLLHKMNGAPKMRVADFLGVRPQTIYKWEAIARDDPDFKLPLKRAIQVALYFNIHPRLLRGDVVWP